MGLLPQESLNPMLDSSNSETNVSPDGADNSCMDVEFTLKLYPLVRALRTYHRHEVFGLENVPSEGPAIIACNHSLATYDMSLLMTAIYDERHRVTRSLIDRAFFRVPGLGEFMERVGSAQGTPENARSLIESGEILMVAPGGMRESLRPSSERYQILWERRKGFVKLALETGTPIVLAACPKADDIFDTFENPLTKLMYKNFKLPLPLLRGLGPTLLPKPVKLRHFLSKPIKPPKAEQDPDAFKEQVEEFHAKIVKKMQELMAFAINYRS